MKRLPWVLVMTISAFLVRHSRAETIPCDDLIVLGLKKSCSSADLKFDSEIAGWQFGYLPKISKDQIKKKDDFEGFRVRYMSGPEIKAKIQQSDDIKKIINDSRCPLPQKIQEHENWYVEFYNDQIRDGLMSQKYVPTLEKPDTKFNTIHEPDLLDNWRKMALIVLRIHEKNIVIADFENSQFVAGFSPEERLKLYILDFENAAKEGDPFDERGGYRFWEPSRFPTQGLTRPAVWSDSMDIYSLGVVFFMKMNDHRFPFEGSTREEYAASLQKGDYTIDQGMPAEFAFLIHSMLQEDSSQRLNGEHLGAAIGILIEKNKYTFLESSLKLNIREEFPKEVENKLDVDFVHEIQLTKKSVKASSEPQDPKRAKRILIAGILVGASILVLIILVTIYIKCRSESGSEQDNAGLENGNATRDQELIPDSGETARSKKQIDKVVI